jgi:hypothetical protein
MCVTCVDDVQAEPVPAVSLSRAQKAELMKRIRFKALERNRLRPEPFPICIRCEMPIDPGEADDIYRRQCVTCGLNKLEQLYCRLTEARGRKARKKATRRLVRFARTGK